MASKERRVFSFYFFKCHFHKTASGDSLSSSASALLLLSFHVFVDMLQIHIVHSVLL